MDKTVMHDEPILNKREFGWDERPPTVPEATPMKEVPFGAVPGDGNPALPASDSVGNDAGEVPDPAVPSIGVMKAPHDNDLTGSWSEGMKGTLPPSVSGFWNKSGSSSGDRGPALGG